jgi:hypothetical protein
LTVSSARCLAPVYILTFHMVGISNRPPFVWRRQMKFSLARGSILTTLVILIILATLPGEIRRLVQTGDPYLFTRQFFQDLFARLSGPGRLRFLVQPSVAIFLGTRDGRKDARAGLPPFLSALLYSGVSRPNVLRNAVAAIRDLVAVAVILDIIFQFLIFRQIHPGAALLVGPVLIAVPYALSRALANRMVIWRRQRMSISRHG